MYKRVTLALCHYSQRRSRNSRHPWLRRRRRPLPYWKSRSSFFTTVSNNRMPLFADGSSGIGESLSLFSKSWPGRDVETSPISRHVSDSLEPTAVNDKWHRCRLKVTGRSTWYRGSIKDLFLSYDVTLNFTECDRPGKCPRGCNSQFKTLALCAIGGSERKGKANNLRLCVAKVQTIINSIIIIYFSMEGFPRDGQRRAGSEYCLLRGEAG